MFSGLSLLDITGIDKWNYTLRGPDGVNSDMYGLNESGFDANAYYYSICDELNPYTVLVKTYDESVYRSRPEHVRNTCTIRKVR
jgi:hypothetical protein